jgi:hypothetical protein
MARDPGQDKGADERPGKEVERMKSHASAMQNASNKENQPAENYVEERHGWSGLVSRKSMFIVSQMAISQFRVAGL